MGSELEPHSLAAEDVLARLDANQGAGLTSGEAARRLIAYGPNSLKRAKPAHPLEVFARQFRSAVVLLLAAAAGVSTLFGEWIESLAIAVVIVINSFIGFATEMTAIRSMAAIYRLGKTSARVRREGRVIEVDAEELVPGDIVEVESGDVVPADARILESNQLASDESALTGESVPVAKSSGPLAAETPLPERSNMLFKGTLVTRGSGAGIVVGTGLRTEVGKITELVESAEDEHTPLEKRLDALGRNLVWVVLMIVILVAGLGVVRGMDIELMVKTGIALAVASIPEGLPVVATIALSRGFLRMARRRALIRRLSSVEALGSATVVFTDKTGTLTENRVTVMRVDTLRGSGVRGDDGEWAIDDTAEAAVRECLKATALCNNASVQNSAERGWATIGDPLEGALLIAATEVGLRPDKLREEFPELREEPFDSESKLMATIHSTAGDGVYVAVKGAPEAVLAACTHIQGEAGPQPLTDEARAGWIRKNNEFAENGMRLIGVAVRSARDAESKPYHDLTFVGLVGMVDPPRTDVHRSIDCCRRAGIRVIMVTGDQAATARFVARAVGIVSADDATVIHGRDLPAGTEASRAALDAVRAANIFARVSPQQKLDLIAAYQHAGEIVAMTGDGINDAPALKKADVGIAMGLRGTQVAREVADVVLKDDAFSTIVSAIEEGRIIFANIRKFVVYLLSCNIAEIMVILFASLLNSPLPILPLQILFLNLVTDVFPALALGMGAGDPAVMNRPPRPAREPLLPLRLWLSIATHATSISAATLTAFFVAQEVLGVLPEVAVTISFMTLATSQLLHVFNMRSRGAGLFSNDIVRNPHVWAAMAFCGLLLACANYVPVLQQVLSTAALSGPQWLIVGGLSLAPVLTDAAGRRLRTLFLHTHRAEARAA